MKRRLILAAPAIIAARGASALMPALMTSGGGLSTPLLDQLSAGTTVIGAWSTARKLKSSATVALNPRVIGGAVQPDTGFNGLLVDTSVLTTANFAVVSLYDQSGNGNTLGRGNSNSQFCPITTPAGALNAPVTCAGGTSAPTFSCGYNGLSVGGTAPNLSTAGLAGGVMNVSFGTTTTLWMAAVLRLVSGLPTSALNGRIAGFTATTGTIETSFAFRNNTNTTGVLGFIGAGTGKSTNAVMPATTLGLVVSVFDGANVTIYCDRVADTPTVYSTGVTAGGIFNIGNFGTNTNNVFGVIAMDMAEIIVGTTLAPADLTLMQANMRSFYGTA